MKLSTRITSEEYDLLPKHIQEKYRYRLEYLDWVLIDIRYATRDMISEGSEKDNINPDHYKQGNIEMIDILKAKLTPEEFIGHLKGDILEYVTREKMKNGLEDLKKAKWYLDYLIDYMDKQDIERRVDLLDGQ